MQGIPVTEDLYSIFSKEKEHEALHKRNRRSHQEQISFLLQNYMKLLLPDDEKFHGGWSLIDCDPRCVITKYIHRHHSRELNIDELQTAFLDWMRKVAAEQSKMV